MLALSEIVDFLLSLMRDENARVEFERDPEGSLARAGLEGISGQDVSDARLQLADSGAVHTHHAGPGYDGASAAHHADPIRQIAYTTEHYQAEESAPPEGTDGHPDVSLEQQSNSFFFQTFNSDDDVTFIDDSVTTVDASSTEVAVTNIEGSFNSDDDVTAIDADNSFNTTEDNDVVAIQDNDTVTEDNDSLVIDATGSFNEAAPAVTDPIAPAPAAPADDPPAAEEPGADVALDEPAPETGSPDELPIDEPADDPFDPADDPSTADTADIGPI